MRNEPITGKIAQRKVDDALKQGHAPSKKDMSIAVGGKAIEAGERLWCILDGMKDIQKMMAPFEAEHQLVLLQRIGTIGYIISNDVDYVVLGGDNILFFEPRGYIWSTAGVFKGGAVHSTSW